MKISISGCRNYDALSNRIQQLTLKISLNKMKLETSKFIAGIILELNFPVILKV